MMTVLGWYINESAFCCKVCFMLASTSLQPEIQLCGMWLTLSLLPGNESDLKDWPPFGNTSYLDALCSNSFPGKSALPSWMPAKQSFSVFVSMHNALVSGIWSRKTCLKLRALYFQLFVHCWKNAWIYVETLGQHSRSPLATASLHTLTLHSCFEGESTI